MPYIQWRGSVSDGRGGIFQTTVMMRGVTDTSPATSRHYSSFSPQNNFDFYNTHMYGSYIHNELRTSGVCTYNISIDIIHRGCKHRKKGVYFSFFSLNNSASCHSRDESGLIVSAGEQRSPAKSGCTRRLPDSQINCRLIVKKNSIEKIGMKSAISPNKTQDGSTKKTSSPAFFLFSRLTF